MKICIDPGHGGYDPGAVGPGKTQEKNIALVVSQYVAAELNALGIETLLTRNSDQVPWSESADLYARCDMANKAGAGYFISIHCNAAANATATGTETYCYQRGGTSEQLARAIQGELVREIGLPDRGVKTANFYVLRETAMPAILIEIAFISNPREEILLKDTSFQKRAARAIATGVAGHLGVSTQAPAQPADPNAVTISVAGRTFAGRLIGDTTYAPVRALAEALGKTVGWDEKTRTVVVE